MIPVSALTAACWLHADGVQGASRLGGHGPKFRCQCQGVWTSGSEGRWRRFLSLTHSGMACCLMHACQVKSTEDLAAAAGMCYLAATGQWLQTTACCKQSFVAWLSVAPPATQQQWAMTAEAQILHNWQAWNLASGLRSSLQGALAHQQGSLVPGSCSSALE